jgi:deazaflavin-dependent oxidoreductase (nitroreductase family)
VVSHYNDRIIAEFRENGGRVQNFGSSLVLLHTIGARSGEARVSPVLAIADGDAWLVIASAGGSPRHPAWYFNLVAHPDVAVETPAGTVDVHATALEGADYDEAWTKFLARSPAFGQYAERTEGRTMPILRLSPR